MEGMLRGLAVAGLLVVGLGAGGCATSEPSRSQASASPPYARCTDSTRRTPYTGADSRPESQPLFFLFCVQGP
jgi:hypothetical protein